MDTSIVFPRQADISGLLEADDWAGIRAHLPGEHAARRYDLSVIVPVFNTAPYVRECLRSLSAQSGLSLQVVIINDGSTDESERIVLSCLEAWNDPRYLLVRQRNRGLSAARNLGMKLALGDYVGFLDSDDFVTPFTYAAMHRLARERSLDMVICRSTVFDHERMTMAPFYDSGIWDELLEGRREVVTSALRSPDILRLEPNANTRLMRRAFMERCGISYPVNLHFEDMPAHLLALVEAQEIGLLDHVGYVYRVNRMGKITDQRSAARFDILAVMDEALAGLKDKPISPDQGAAIVYALLRISYWCGCNTVLGDRRRFFTALSTRFQRLPRPWVKRFHLRYARLKKQRRILFALADGRPDYVFWRSVDANPLRQRVALALARSSFARPMGRLLAQPSAAGAR